MHRICGELQKNDYDVLLIGRVRKHSLPLTDKPFRQQRIRCWFEKGKLFYLEYNFRLLITLFSVKVDIYGAVDLDAALPLYLHARRNKKPWTFDAHEYFSELEEVVTRPFVHQIWKWVERFIVQRAQHAYTISESYAKQYEAQYGTPFKIIRNVPVKSAIQPDQQHPSDPAIIIYQGALNIGRGLEESIAAMEGIEGAELHIYGDGPIRDRLTEQVKAAQLEHKVKLMGSRLPEQLRAITQKADIGLTLFSATGFHHRHSLANRFFDYIHAGIPQVCMNYPEYQRFNEVYHIAEPITSLDAMTIQQAVLKLLGDEEHYQRLREATHEAAEDHNWQVESQRLLNIYRDL